MLDDSSGLNELPIPAQPSRRRNDPITGPGGRQFFPPAEGARPTNDRSIPSNNSLGGNFLAPIINGVNTIRSAMTSKLNGSLPSSASKPNYGGQQGYVPLGNGAYRQGRTEGSRYFVNGQQEPVLTSQSPARGGGTLSVIPGPGNAPENATAEQIRDANVAAYERQFNAVKSENDYLTGGRNRGYELPEPPNFNNNEYYQKAEQIMNNLPRGTFGDRRRRETLTNKANLLMNIGQSLNSNQAAMYGSQLNAYSRANSDRNQYDLARQQENTRLNLANQQGRLQQEQTEMQYGPQYRSQEAINQLRSQYLNAPEGSDAQRMLANQLSRIQGIGQNTKPTIIPFQNVDGQKMVAMPRMDQNGQIMQPSEQDIQAYFEVLRRDPKSAGMAKQLFDRHYGMGMGDYYKNMYFNDEPLQE